MKKQKDNSETDAVEFGEWLRTFSALTRVNGFWCLETQISTEQLYLHFLSWKKSKEDERKKTF